jgi:hypothetical protein
MHTGTARIFSANKRYVSYKFPFNSDSPPSVISPASSLFGLEIAVFIEHVGYFYATACRSSSSRAGDPYLVSNMQSRMNLEVL